MHNPSSLFGDTNLSYDYFETDGEEYDSLDQAAKDFLRDFGDGAEEYNCGEDENSEEDNYVLDEDEDNEDDYDWNGKVPRFVTPEEEAYLTSKGGDIDHSVYLIIKERDTPVTFEEAEESARVSNSPDPVHKALRQYFKCQFRKKEPFIHPGLAHFPEQSFSHEEVERALGYLRKECPRQYKALWRAWTTGGSCSFIAQNFFCSESNLRRLWAAAYENFLKILIYPDLIPLDDDEPDSGAIERSCF